jgi:hypothetical protein
MDRMRKREDMWVFENGMLTRILGMRESNRRVRWVGYIAEDQSIQKFCRKT